MFNGMGPYCCTLALFTQECSGFLQNKASTFNSLRVRGVWMGCFSSHFIYQNTYKIHECAEAIIKQDDFTGIRLF